MSEQQTTRTYSNREYYEMVRCYLLSGESLRGAQRLYESESLRRLQKQGINSSVPNRRTIMAANQRLLEHGQFSTPAHATSRGGHATISPAVENAVIEFFERDPRASTREASRQFGVSRYYVWNLLNSLGYHYKHVPALHDDDGPPRVQFCQWLLSNIDSTNILWTDEALFTRVGIYNSRNERYWAMNDSHVIKDSHHQVRFSVNVWAGIIDNEILGPFFIEGRLTGGNYLKILRSVSSDFLENVPLALLNNFYYQHDDAPPHYSSGVRDYLNNEYGDKWIGRGGPVPWPPRSSDLTPLDFYLWGEIKKRVYVEEAQSYEDLRSKIVTAFEDLKRAQPQVILKNSLRKRAQLCIKRNGLNFEHLLKY